MLSNHKVTKLVGALGAASAAALFSAPAFAGASQNACPMSPTAQELSADQSLGDPDVRTFVVSEMTPDGLAYVIHVLPAAEGTNIRTKASSAMSKPSDDLSLGDMDQSTHVVREVTPDGTEYMIRSKASPHQTIANLDGDLSTQTAGAPDPNARDDGNGGMMHAPKETDPPMGSPVHTSARDDGNSGATNLSALTAGPIGFDDVYPG
ncbi:MAG: hypothetical protein GC151_18470 [Betaproteobacteria bacterium]|nr:hypothetical protein [Betaproteobacteria bacterium]